MKNKNSFYKNYSNLLNEIKKIDLDESIKSKRYTFSLSSIKYDKNGKLKIKNKKESI